MKEIRVSEDIIPLGKFKTRAAQIIKELSRRGNAMVITQNGKPACVVMSPVEFDRLRQRQAFLEAVARGIQDVETGRVVSDEELGRRLDAEFGPLDER